MSELAKAIISLLDNAASTTKRKEKESILSSALTWNEEDQSILKAVFVYAQDPRISFGIKDLSDITPVTLPHDDELFLMFDVLRKLSVRSITGQEAKAGIGRVFGSVSASTLELFKRILGRDLKAGIGAKTFNSVFGDVVYIHPYMRCSLLNEKTMPNLTFPCYSQTKLDGMYVDIRVEPDKVTYFSRDGNIMPFNDRERDSLLITFAAGYTLQGEALVLNEERNGWIDRSKNNGYLNSDDIDINRVVFVCWDAINNAEHGFHQSNVMYQSRLSFLEGVVYRVSQYNGSIVKLVDTVECSTIEDVINHFKKNRSEGLEGTVVKNKLLKWKDGTSKEQLKLKVSAVGDLKVVGWKEGEGKWEGYVGSLVCQSSCGKVEVNVNCKTDAFRKKATKSIDAWIDAGVIVSVVYNDIVQNELKPELKALYLPRMETDDIRSDKHEADSLDRLQEILDNFEFLV